MHINPKDLDQFLTQIKTTFNNSDLVANPFLSLVKPTAENLEKYSVLRPQSKLWFVMSIIGMLPMILARIVYSASISIASIPENRNWDVKNIKKTCNLYISHFTYAQSPSSDDLFFGKCIRPTEDTVFYLNSTRENGVSIQKSYLATGKVNVVLNTKSLGLLKMLNMHRKQFQITFQLFSLVVARNQYTLFQKRLLIRMSIFQHSRQTTANLVTKVRLSEVISTCSPKNLVLTIEGHAHEAMVLHLRDTYFSDVSVVGFQHAPIVPGQFSFYSLLKEFRATDLLLTCGKVTHDLISKVLPDLSIKILGSPKSVGFASPLKSETTINVLGAVEGTSESLITYIVLFNRLSKLLPTMQFLLRLHPALPPSTSRKLLEGLFTSDNLKVSTNSLAVDLNNAHVTIFRSSAVGLEGLAYAALPVHFDTEKNGYLNPLSQVECPKKAFSSVEELAEFLKGYPLTLNNTADFREECVRVNINYYFPMEDINLLID